MMIKYLTSIVTWSKTKRYELPKNKKLALNSYLFRFGIINSPKFGIIFSLAFFALKVKPIATINFPKFGIIFFGGLFFLEGQTKNLGTMPKCLVNYSLVKKNKLAFGMAFKKYPILIYFVTE